VALIGYARVSTADQKLSLQHDALNAAGATVYSTITHLGQKPIGPACPTRSPICAVAIRWWCGSSTASAAR
jgi:hypothetical protein